MIFTEIHGTYFDAVSAILKEAADGRLTRKRITELAMEKGFSESVLTIPQKLTDGSWPLLTKELGTPIKTVPPLPPTDLEKRWLKSLLLDPRIRLFDVDPHGLEDVTPLFTPDQLVWYDRCSDGDPYEDEAYIARFKTILEAIRTHRLLEICFVSGKGQRNTWKVVPVRLEYSSMNDKFRLLAHAAMRKDCSLNLKRMTSVKLLKEAPREAFTEFTPPQDEVVFELVDERNALERVMLQFSYLAKETVRLDEKHYRVTLRYAHEDETEMVIKLLSFGPRIRVISSARFITLMKERIRKQLSCGLFM